MKHRIELTQEDLEQILKEWANKRFLINDGLPHTKVEWGGDFTDEIIVFAVVSTEKQT